MYINIIFNANHKFKYTIYAHDTNFFLNDEGVNSLHFNVKIELDAVNKRIKSDNLNLIVSKTKYVGHQNQLIIVDFPPVTRGNSATSCHKLNSLVSIYLKILIGIINLIRW